MRFGGQVIYGTEAMTVALEAIEAEAQSHSGSPYLFQRGVVVGLEAAASAIRNAMATPAETAASARIVAAVALGANLREPESNR